MVSKPQSVPEPSADTAELLAQARMLERTGARHGAESAYDAIIVAATRQTDQAVLAEACRRRAVLAHQAGDSARARSGLRQWRTGLPALCRLSLSGGVGARQIDLLRGFACNALEPHAVRGILGDDRMSDESENECKRGDLPAA